MPRYIDADALNAKIRSMEYHANTERKRFTIDDLSEQVNWILHEVIPAAIDNTPTADVVEVVRCEKCVHSEKTPACEAEELWCDVWQFYTRCNGFCEKGERNEQS